MGPTAPVQILCPYKYTSAKLMREWRKNRKPSNVYWTVHHCNSWGMKNQLDVTCYLFHLLCAQHVSDINISIFRSLRLLLLNYHIGRLVLSSLCVGDLVWLVLSSARVAGWSCASVCNTGTTQYQPHQISNTQRTENKTTDVVIQQQQSQAPEDGYINVRNMLSA